MNTEDSHRPYRESTSTEGLNSILICIEGEDTTRRPRRPTIPRFWPSDLPTTPPPSEHDPIQNA